MQTQRRWAPAKTQGACCQRRLDSRKRGLPNTVRVGYNSIRVDDEVTRHMLWRNLMGSHAREWRNGCSRWDLLDVMHPRLAS